MRRGLRAAAWLGLAASAALVPVVFVAQAKAAGIHTGRLWVSPHGVVQHSTLPHCRYENGSGGGEANLPCTWNVGPPRNGNGHGLAYWVGRDHRGHYVWNLDPTIGTERRWVTRELADALAEGAGPHADTRPWERCVFTARGPEGLRIRVRCPDGTVHRS